MEVTSEPVTSNGRPRRRPFVIAIAAVVALTTVVVVLLRPPGHHAPVAQALPVSAPPSPPLPAPHPSMPAPVASRPVIPHEAVAPAVPTAFTLTGPKFTINAHVCAMPVVFPLDPPGEQRHTVCWVQKGFGVKPGSDSATSYVLGHSWAPDPQEVLNRLSAPATREILAAKPVMRDGVLTFPVHAVDGYRLVLRTPTGRLTYKVHDAFGVAKNQLGKMHSVLNAKVRHRVVLITCAERGGVDYDYNVVVNAYLWSAKAAPSGIGR